MNATRPGLPFSIPGTRPVFGAAPMTMFGFTAPTTIYEKMRSIDRSAQDLNTKIHVYSRDATLKQAWDAWYQNWQAFSSKYSDSYWNKLGAAFYSDELDAQTDEQWRQYVVLQNRYESERDAQGRALPGPIVPLAAPPTVKPGGGGAGWSVPWWIWAGLGVAAVGVGVYVYIQYRELKTGAGALGGFFGRSGAPARDPERDPTNISFYARRLAHDYPALATGPVSPLNGGRVFGLEQRDTVHSYDAPIRSHSEDGYDDYPPDHSYDRY